MNAPQTPPQGTYNQERPLTQAFSWTTHKMNVVNALSPPISKGFKRQVSIFKGGKQWEITKGITEGEIQVLSLKSVQIGNKFLENQDSNSYLRKISHNTEF